MAKIVSYFFKAAFCFLVVAAQTCVAAAAQEISTTVQTSSLQNTDSIESDTNEVLTNNAPSDAFDKSYSRSSLASIMIFHPEDSFGVEIQEAFLSMKCPDKYNDHNLSIRSIDNGLFKGVKNKRSIGLIKAKYGKKLSSKDIKKNAMKLEEFLNEKNMGRDLVAKWFCMDLNRLDTAKSSMKLIQERGQYNATEMDVAVAQQSARGLALLSDAGEELIKNTYILVNDITYATVEEKMAVGKGVVRGILGVLSFVTSIDTRGLADATTDLMDSFTGFSVKTHSYLFRLDWNDSIAGVFYNDYYTASPNKEKLLKFMEDTSNFKLRYVAHQYEFNSKSSTNKKDIARRNLIKLTCARSVDKNITNLGASYPDFKVKTPIYDIVSNKKGATIGYAAKIGLKEGVSKKSKFSLLEKKFDPETQKTSYRVCGQLKPKAGKIWDNRFMAAEVPDEESEGTAKHPYTIFKKITGGEILPGMLIIEGKYKSTKD